MNLAILHTFKYVRHMKKLLVLLFVVWGLLSVAQTITLQEVYSGFDNPIDIENCGDARLFIVEQDGVIKVIAPDSTINPIPFLDIDAVVGSNGIEQGLLGLAFHPDYQSNGYFYVNYTNNVGSTIISRFTVSGNVNIADASSETVIMTVVQPFTNHNGGDLSFGPDGYLYIGFGDGGGPGDPWGYAQDTQSLLGKMLRIDVDGGFPYGIPIDNPYIGNPNFQDEIWAIGLRNPWRFSFDKLTGDLWIGDVGQNSLEEINLQDAASRGGENYGWRCYEGSSPYNTSNCGSSSTYDFPIAEYSHTGSNCSVTGGFVYRGFEYPALYGNYYYVDYCSGIFKYITGSGYTANASTSTDFGFSSFGEDQNSEVYVTNRSNGNIYKLTSIENCKLESNIMLGGPYNLVDGLMDDNLRVAGLIPLEDPYGFGYFINETVLDVAGPDAIVDWVYLQLRSSVNSGLIEIDMPALIQRNGDIVNMDGFSPVSFPYPPNQYFISVHHRNHLGFMTENIQDFSNGILALNFSNISTYGNDATMAIIGGEAMWPGDVTGDGIVKYTGLDNDRDGILIEIGGSTTNTTSGYKYEDVNMDGIVKYTGNNNDRDDILLVIGGIIPTNTKIAQLP